MSTKPKPRNWIERLLTPCDDRLHGWLLDEIGFEEYVAHGWSSLRDSTELPFDLWVKWWNEGHSPGLVSYTIRFSDFEAVRALWSPVLARYYERELRLTRIANTPPNDNIHAALRHIAQSAIRFTG